PFGFGSDRFGRLCRFCRLCGLLFLRLRGLFFFCRDRRRLDRFGHGRHGRGERWEARRGLAERRFRRGRRNWCEGGRRVRGRCVLLTLRRRLNRRRRWGCERLRRRRERRRGRREPWRDGGRSRRCLGRGRATELAHTRKEIADGQRVARGHAYRGRVGGRGGGGRAP